MQVLKEYIHYESAYKSMNDVPNHFSFSDYNLDLAKMMLCRHLIRIFFTALVAPIVMSIFQKCSLQLFSVLVKNS